MKATSNTRYCNYKQAMEYMGIGSYNTLHRYISLGLKVTAAPRGFQIDKHDMDKFLAQYKK